MDSVPDMHFEDDVFKLVNFDDKLKVFSQQTYVNPHLAFHAGRGYSNYRGRGNYNNGGGYRGRGNNS